MRIKVCMGKACSDRFSQYIITRLKNDTERFNLDKVEIEESKCMGECKKGPNVKVDKNIYNYMQPAKAAELVMGNKKRPKKNKRKSENKDES